MNNLTKQSLLRLGPVITSLLRFNFLIITLFAVISGCVSRPVKQIAVSVEDLETWQAKGKLSIITEGKARTINFNWSNAANTFDIQLHGTLGLGTARLTKNQGPEIVLTTGQGVTRADSAEALLFDKLGWSIPVSELAFWIKGMASPYSHIQSLRKDEKGLLQQLDQQGWQINYQRYHDVQSLQLPKKIAAAHNGLTLRVAIKSWRF